MTLIVVDQGEQHFLERMLGVDYTLRLYTNDVTDGLTQEQVDALTEADFDEATFTGYTPTALASGGWTITAGDPSVGEYAEQTFRSTTDQSAQMLRGYWITRTSDHRLVMFEPFRQPIRIELEDDQVIVQPRITLRDE